MLQWVFLLVLLVWFWIRWIHGGGDHVTMHQRTSSNKETRKERKVTFVEGIITVSGVCTDADNEETADTENEDNTHTLRYRVERSSVPCSLSIN